MLLMRGRGRAASNPGRNALKQSTRSIHLLSEFGRDEHLDIDPDLCRIEFPDANSPEAAGKYKRFFVHYRPKFGLYSGGEFTIEFDVRKCPEYPNRPPHARMLTKIWHPNIDLQGAICHNYLKCDDKAFGEGAGWSPVIKMQGLVNGILTMFDYTNANEHSDSFFADDPLNIEAANEFTHDPFAFEKHAKEWVQQYAKK
eukprot:TRINITY_DN17728_c0_g1_i1.p2 TRINITY_DN17728_c0_g1~~TRINITY_DN17728_c0_g1_i1.p2  ORF type:complete len:199 (-),score=66.05 TRINITY_DN17728_c0_g1_i1:102-698(-)